MSGGQSSTAGDRRGPTTDRIRLVASGTRRQTGTGRRGRDPSSPSERGGRGQTSIIAVVLLVAIVVVGSVGILLLAGSSQEQIQDDVDQERVEQTFAALDQGIGTVIDSQQPRATRKTELDLPGEEASAVRIEDAGQIRINRTDIVAGRNVTVFEGSIGAIKYEPEGGSLVAYQSTGVFRDAGTGTRLVSSPEVSYTTGPEGGDPTLSVPVVVTRGPREIDEGAVTLQKVRTVSPVDDATVVQNGVVEITVESRWYLGWARHFRRIAASTGANPAKAVSVDNETGTTSLRVTVPSDRAPVVAGLVTGSGEQDTVVEDSSLDGYNSSEGPYPASARTGRAAVAGDLTLRESTLTADVAVGRAANFDTTDARVAEGNLSYGTAARTTDTTDLDDHVPDGWHAANATVPEYDPIAGAIDYQRTRFAREAGNDNDAVAAISDARLSGCSSTCRLPAGQYFLEEVDLSPGDRLVLDTTNGGVDVAVNGSLTVRGATVEVVGDGRANVFVDSTRPTGADIRVVDGATVSVAGDRAPGLWIYAKGDAQAVLRDASLTGVLVGPGEGEGEADDGVDVDLRNAEMYGAVVGDVNRLADATIHHDTAVDDAPTLDDDTLAPDLSFLRVTVYEVCVVETDRAGECSARPRAAVTADPAGVDSGETVEFDASGTVDDGEIAAYEWDFDGDGTVDERTTDPVVEHSYEESGRYEATVRVIDRSNQSDRATTTVGVDRPPFNVTVTHAPDAPRVRETVEFAASAAGESPLTYEWDLDGDGEFEETGQSVETFYTSSGEQSVTVRVTDRDGRTTTHTKRVRVRPLVADPGGPYVVEEGATETLDAGASVGSGDRSYYWSIADDPTGEVRLRNRYAKRVRFVAPDDVDEDTEVTLDLVVNDGESVTRREVTVTVDDTTNAPPVADAEAPAEVPEGGTIELDGTASSDPDGDDLSYDWSVQNWPSIGSVRNADSKTATYEAPADVDGDTEVRIRLTVEDEHGETDFVDTTVVVHDEG